MFENIIDNVKIENNKISFKAKKYNSFFMINLGNCGKVKFFSALHRKDLFWNEPKTGTDISDIPIETQWLLMEYNDNTYGIIIPLVIEPYRCALVGKDNNLYVYCETGDDAVEIDSGIVAYFIKGENPYDMMKCAAMDIAELLPELRTIENKKIPEFVNYFGWCTWDSFYKEVNIEGVKSGLTNFKENGVMPGFMILDDGWQSVDEVNKDRGKDQLSSFKANEKFEHTLSPVVKMAKEEYGIKMFMVWHAVMGYWGGVHPTASEMSEFDVRMKMQNQSEAMYSANEESAKIFHFPFGFINPDKAFDFYNEYHSLLRREGVDGVKIDVQAAIESLAQGDGGRVTTTKKIRKGMEASVNHNFDGNLINCMSCSNDHIFNTLSTAVMRSSIDYLPKKPESHGKHILDNAYSGMFMSEFLMCDWDMFQTQYEYGDFHAAARAVSGGPVYVSDKVGEHDFEIIDKMIMADSRVPLCTKNARPTIDSLFMDRYNTDEIFKIFNYNRYSGVIGAFNLTTDKKLVKKVAPKDINGYNSGEYIVYDSKNSKAVKMNCDEIIECELNPIDFNLYIVAEIRDGIAPIGLVNKYNIGGTITRYEKNYNTMLISVGDGGEMLIYMNKTPLKVYENKKQCEFSYDTEMLRINLEKGKVHDIYIEF